MLHHSDVRLHPRVLIALDWHHHFGRAQDMRQRRCSVWLRLVPIRIFALREVDVVSRRIAVGDAYRLLYDHTQNVRLIVASVLVQDYW